MPGSAGTTCRAFGASNRRQGRRPGPAVAALALGLATVPVAAWAANEDNDLDRIPDAVNSAAPPSPAVVTQSPPQLLVESAPQAGFWRSRLVVPVPNTNPSDFSNRLSLDLRTEMALGDGVTATLADRFSVLGESGRAFTSRNDLANDLKEAYLTWTAGGPWFVDAGRINVKQGVALGFNPTDYFKTNAVTLRVSEDPGVLRDNRLGTLMMRSQVVGETAAAAAIWAPVVDHRPGRWWSGGAVDGLGFDRTNRNDRVLLRGSATLAQDFSPEVLYYHEADRSQIGINLTRGLGDAVVLYGEASGGFRPNLISEALTDARQRGLVPWMAPFPLGIDTRGRLQTQAAIGFSYATEPKITTHVEYHFNQAGFSGADWKRWFDAGRQPSARGPLWQIRQYAEDTQQPVSQHTGFVRALWEDALVPDLNLTAIVETSLEDASSFLQLEAAYFVSPKLTVGLTVGDNLGGGRSERGSLSEAGSLMTTFRVYF
ncbi:MAG: hypothetical protein HQL37_01175 [Alphaproteobacteria bacterium]|nr:hypothetical protein [Alphaproteobacteria bacterium]